MFERVIFSFLNICFYNFLFFLVFFFVFEVTIFAKIPTDRSLINGPIFVLRSMIYGRFINIFHLLKMKELKNTISDREGLKKRGVQIHRTKSFILVCVSLSLKGSLDPGNSISNASKMLSDRPFLYQQKKTKKKSNQKRKT